MIVFIDAMFANLDSNACIFTHIVIEYSVLCTQDVVFVCVVNFSNVVTKVKISTKKIVQKVRLYVVLLLLLNVLHANFTIDCARVRVCVCVCTRYHSILFGFLVTEVV